MKKITWILLTLLSTQMGIAQTTETIATGQNFGEITVRGTTLYTGGLLPVVTSYDVSDTNFTATTVASGPGVNAHLRFTVDDTEENVYLSEFAGALFAAPIASTETTLTPLGSETELEILGLDITGDMVYFTTSAPQIIRFNRNNPDGTLELFFETSTVLPIFNTIIEDNLLYYSTQSDFNNPEFQIFSLDITQPAQQPQLVTTTPERAWTFTIEGDEFYIASDQNNTVYLKNLSDGTTDAAVVVRTLDLGANTNIYSLDLENDFFYFSATGNQGGIFRIGTENLSVADNELPEVKLFPNPSSQFLNVTGITASTPYTILDMSGKRIQAGFINSDTSIDINALASGVYFINVSEIATLRFIKE